MTTYSIDIDAHNTVNVYVTISPIQGIHAWSDITATHDGGDTEDYGQTDSTHYLGYCLTEVVAHEAIRVLSNYPQLSDDFNVWECLPDSLPECQCD